MLELSRKQTRAMAAKKPHSKPAQLPAERLTHNTLDRGSGIVQRWRGRNSDRKRARLVNPRSRRVLASWLRRTADRAQETPSTLQEPLQYRVAAARTKLLELAALLEHAPAPDPASVIALRDLLANRRDSPLYNPNIPAVELDEALKRIRSGLANAPP
jgi:hypothetical protein